MIDHIVSKIATSTDDRTLVPTEYCGNFVADIPTFWLETQGHRLQDRIVEAFPALQEVPARS